MAPRTSARDKQERWNQEDVFCIVPGTSRRLTDLLWLCKLSSPVLSPEGDINPACAMQRDGVTCKDVESSGARKPAGWQGCP